MNNNTFNQPEMEGNEKPIIGTALKCLIVLFIGLALFVYTNDGDTIETPETVQAPVTGDEPGIAEEGVYTKIIYVPANGTPTGDWRFPSCREEWEFKATCTGDLNWFPNETDLVELTDGKRVNTGYNNPNNLNFRFASRTGKEEKVLIQYKLKKKYKEPIRVVLGSGKSRHVVYI